MLRWCCWLFFAVISHDIYFLIWCHAAAITLFSCALFSPRRYSPLILMHFSFRMIFFFLSLPPLFCLYIFISQPFAYRLFYISFSAFSLFLLLLWFLRLLLFSFPMSLLFLIFRILLCWCLILLHFSFSSISLSSFHFFICLPLFFSLFRFSHAMLSPCFALRRHFVHATTLLPPLWCLMRHLTLRYSISLFDYFAMLHFLHVTMPQLWCCWCFIIYIIDASATPSPLLLDMFMPRYFYERDVGAPICCRHYAPRCAR